MEHLEKKVDELSTTNDIELKCKILQEINHLVLTEYMIKLKDVCVYPIEIEVYYYDETSFVDGYVHKNELQKNRFGKLYFHRKSKNKEGRFLLYRGGVDICLSNSDSFYLSILIRGIRINNYLTICSKPNDVARYLLGDFSDIQTRISELEELICLVRSVNEPRQNNLIINTQRYGLTPNKYPDFYNYNLRTLTEFGARFPYNAYKDKEKIAISYFKQRNKAVKEEEVIELLGYSSQNVLTQTQYYE